MSLSDLYIWMLLISPFLLSNFAQALSGWMESTNEQQFSSLTTDSQSDWAILTHSGSWFKPLQCSFVICLGLLSSWKIHPSLKSFADRNIFSFRNALYLDPSICPQR